MQLEARVGGEVGEQGLLRVVPPQHRRVGLDPGGQMMVGAGEEEKGVAVARPADDHVAAEPPDRVEFGLDATEESVGLRRAKLFEIHDRLGQRTCPFAVKLW